MSAKTIREELNKNAELSWQEYKSTEIIANYLKQNNIRYKKLPNTGLIAKRGWKNPILLRAELDALPFGNETKHACGHDIHAAALATALPKIKKAFIAVFQPSEEDYPSGAKHTMQHIKNYSKAIALHVDPTLPIGKIGIKAGYVMGSVDLIRAKIKGKPAHTAFPEEGRDAILASAKLVSKISKAFPSKRCSVVISKIQGGLKDNIVCDEVNLEGTSRALDEDLRFKIKSGIEEICNELSHKLDLEIEFRFIKGYPSLYNNLELTSGIRERLKQVFGESNVVPGTSCLANDDFAFFSEKAPICYIRVGCGNGKLHTKDFHPPDEVVGICRKIFITLANQRKL